MADKSVVVKTEDGDVRVKRLALKDYGKLLSKLQKMPEQFGKFINENSKEQLKDPQVLAAQLPALITTAVDEFSEFISTVTDKSPDFHSELSLLETVKIVEAALEVNDYKEIVETVKKMMPPKPEQPTPAAPEAPTPTPTPVTS